jgi:hypothetical protein
MMKERSGSIFIGFIILFGFFSFCVLDRETPWRLLDPFFLFVSFLLLFLLPFVSFFYCFTCFLTPTRTHIPNRKLEEEGLTMRCCCYSLPLFFLCFLQPEREGQKLREFPILLGRNWGREGRESKESLRCFEWEFFCWELREAEGEQERV